MLKLFKNQLDLLVNKNIISARTIFTSSLVPNQQATGSSNSNLFKIRKATGYALNRCKEALEKNNGNIEESIKWLHEQAQKEGWAKAEKLKGRSTTQGTLVFFANKDNNSATLVELNCETDFVARNEKFLDLSSNIAISVLSNAQASANKTLLNQEDLIKINYLKESKTIGDQIALSIGSLGENMAIRRAVIFSLGDKEQKLAWYMHGTATQPVNNCHFGRYGSIVSFRQTQRNENYLPFDLGRQIAQHVVGLKPLVIGDLPANNTETGEINIDDNDTRLLYQGFLMKPEIRVLDFLQQNHLIVDDFVRFERGEEI